MTSPPLPSPAGCEAADHSSNVPIPAEKLYEDFTVPEVVFLDSRLAAISLLSEMLTYKSIGLDASMAERRLIWHLPIELTGWEYWVSHNLLPL
jgi:hypothetical protein